MVKAEVYDVENSSFEDKKKFYDAFLKFAESQGYPSITRNYGHQSPHIVSGRISYVSDCIAEVVFIENSPSLTLVGNSWPIKRAISKLEKITGFKLKKVGN